MMKIEGTLVIFFADKASIDGFDVSDVSSKFSPSCINASNIGFTVESVMFLCSGFHVV